MAGDDSGSPARVVRAWATGDGGPGAVDCAMASEDWSIDGGLGLA
jgi:hypothetical protein